MTQGVLRRPSIPDTDEGPTSRNHDREACFVGLMAAGGVTLIGLAFDPPDARLLGWIIPAALVLWAGALAPGFTRWREELWRGPVILFTAVGAYLVAFLGTHALVGRGAGEPAFLATGYWFPALYAMAFLLFGFRTGVRISVALYLVGALLGAVAVVGQRSTAGTGGELAALATMYAFGVLFLLLFATFTRTGERHTGVVSALSSLAHTCSLTRVHNRRSLIHLLDQARVRAERYGGELSVMMLDLDHFKGVNDEHGHVVGDRCLSQLGSILRDSARAADQVGRWGGEEFLLILPETGSKDGAALAHRIRRRVERHAFGTGKPLTVSAGVAEYREGEGLWSVVQRADQALYAAKRAGRNAVCIASDGVVEETVKAVPEV